MISHTVFAEGYKLFELSVGAAMLMPDMVLRSLALQMNRVSVNKQEYNINDVPIYNSAVQAT